MAILSFTLSPESLGRLHDSLVCLGKFSESVSIEAAHDKLLLYSLNSSKSAYAAFTLAGNSFFSKYQYTPAPSRSREKFNCKIYNKALLSVFKGRSVDPEKDTAIERCDVSVEDGEGVAKSRFIIKIVCRHGVLKTYRLTFESVPASHAIFVKESANNRWSISSKTLREFVDHFGPGTEQLDIYSEDGRVSFTSYTEKVMSGNEILKQPLHTTIAIDTQEFTEFSVEDKLHLVTSVKDFKSIITHAGTTHTVVHARYSRPSNPLQLTYSDEGIACEFILMTIGDSRGASATPVPAGRTSNRPVSRQPPALEAATSSRRSGKSAEMPPPPARGGPSFSRNASRPSPPPPQPSIQSNALFLPEEDEDRRWDPVTYDDEEDQEMLLWDDAAANSGPRLQASEKQSQSINSRGKSNGGSTHDNPTPRIAPTQGLSQVRGIFDD